MPDTPSQTEPGSAQVPTDPTGARAGEPAPQVAAEPSQDTPDRRGLIATLLDRLRGR